MVAEDSDGVPLLNADTLASLEEIHIPRRFDVQFNTKGLRIVRQSQPAQKIAAQLTPYKSRGGTYRRLRASLNDGREYVVEFASSTPHDTRCPSWVLFVRATMS